MVSNKIDIKFQNSQNNWVVAMKIYQNNHENNIFKNNVEDNCC